MAILGISTATKNISVGLADKGKILAELTISGKNAFTEDLVQYIDKITKEAEVSLSAISVASGPGSYSGLRGGLAVAKTLAQVKKIPLLEVSTLEAIAYNLIDIEATIAAISDARRDEFNIAFFTSSNKMLRRLTGDSVMKLDKIVGLLLKIQGELHICGTTSEIYDPVLAKKPDSNIITASPQASIAKGINVAFIGEKLIKERKLSDPMKLSPKYSVEPHIREFKR